MTSYRQINICTKASFKDEENEKWLNKEYAKLRIVAAGCIYANSYMIKGTITLKEISQLFWQHIYNIVIKYNNKQ